MPALGNVISRSLAFAEPLREQPPNGTTKTGSPAADPMTSMLRVLPHPGGPRALEGGAVSRGPQSAGLLTGGAGKSDCSLSVTNASK